MGDERATMPAGSSPVPGPNPAASAGRDRTTVVTYAILFAATTAAWVHVLWTAMTDDMAGMDMAMSPAVLEGLAFVAAWTVMMAAMMLPSALPMIALFAATQRNTAAPTRTALPVTVFTLIYLGLWAVTGVPIYFVSVALSVLATDVRAYTVAGMLVVAGIFQLSPLKHVCLRRCRSPLGFFLGHWRGGWRGSLAIGWAHAAYCLGCCWALMVVLVGAGAMGLAWVLLIAAVVASEKLLPRGERIAVMTGLALVLLGLAVAVRPELAVALRGGGPSM
jgi:predicted metal-binding membrane protein